MSTHFSHRQDGYNMLSGQGLEIGACHQPATIPAHCTIEYCDAHSKEDAAKLFPELNINDLVEVNYICDLDKNRLSIFAAEHFDFVILNHVIEHVANPIKVVEELFRVTKNGGYVIISAPDKNFTFDKDRALTSFAHLREEYENNVDFVTDAHYIEFLQAVHPNAFKQGPAKLPKHINNVRKRHEHVHVWESQTFDKFMMNTLELLQLQATRVFVSFGNNNQVEYFSVWKKLFKKKSSVWKKLFKKKSVETSILDQYIKTAPSHQNALDTFKGEWSSKLPPPYAELIAGKALLFEDPRMKWAIEQLGGVKGSKVLELGPLEGGHTYMFENMGASSIFAIEANTRAYIKCLITKEILNLKRARFMLGDFITYLQNTQDTYDICIASGVLYHMRKPAELIHMISKVSEKVMLWTHYYDQTLLENNPNIKKDKFSAKVDENCQGFKHVLYRQNYQEAIVDWAGFCGGSESYSMWMSRQDILSCLNYFGFNKLEIEFEQLEHPSGPCFCITGLKSDE